MHAILLSLLFSYKPGMSINAGRADSTNCSLNGMVTFDGKRFRNVTVIVAHEKEEIYLSSYTDDTGYYCLNFKVNVGAEYELWIYHPFYLMKLYYYRVKLKFPNNRFDQHFENPLYKEP